MPRSWTGEFNKERLFDGKRTDKRMSVADSAEQSDTIEAITLALAHWALLYDVPFQYLVSGEKLLPENSMRFFYMDSNWVRAMLDGTLSIGRDSKVDFSHDAVFIDSVYAKALRHASVIRANLQGKETAEETGMFDLCSGFLMRSPLVPGWRGLDFEAFDANGGVLKALRIETLSHEVLLAMYAGKISRVIIHEPPEGLYYEVVSGNDGKYILLRNSQTGKANGSKVPITIKPSLSSPGVSSRVVDFKALAVGLNGADSANMALQLLKLPSYAVFDDK